jgi:polar amino acid transport system substrate-binding protein
MSVRALHHVAGLCLPAVLVLALAGCGGSGGSSSTSSGAAAAASTSTPAATGTDDAVAALVPAAIKAKGTLRIASDASYPPNEFIGSDGKTVVGMDADLAKALAAVMGLKAEVRNASFDGIIPGLAAGKYDLGMSSFSDTKEREKVVDFVTYFQAGTAFLSPASSSTSYSSLSDLCGRKVAVEKGTTQADDAIAQGKKCAADGKPAATVSVFPDQNGANLAIVSGRADVGMVDSPVGAYEAKRSGGKLKISKATYDVALYGIAVPKDSGMSKAVLAAVKAVMADGRYAAILTKWGISSGAISAPVVNGATS